MSHDLCYACMLWYRFSSSRTLCSVLHRCQGHQGGKHCGTMQTGSAGQWSRRSLARCVRCSFHKGSFVAGVIPITVEMSPAVIPKYLLSAPALATLPCFIRITLVIAIVGDCEPVENPKTNESNFSVESLLFVTSTCKNLGFCQSRRSDVNCEGRARAEEM